jgi:hypothetical protein
MKPESVKIISITEATMKMSRPIVGLGDDGIVYQYDVRAKIWKEFK